MTLVLSIFPGIDLLGRAFEEDGFCIVRGPDVLWGGDIHTFHPPAGVFAGVIGSDPCQAHCKLNAINRAIGRQPRFPDLTPEFRSLIEEAQPIWFLRENVPTAPALESTGYMVQILRINNRWLGEEQNRERCFWFGTRDGRRLCLDGEIVPLENPSFEYAVTGKGVAGEGLQYDRGNTNRPAYAVQKRIEARRRPWGRLCELQGMPPRFLEHAPFTLAGKKRALGNGVPLPMGRAIARAVKRAMERM